CARVLGRPVPGVQRGAVIKADMAVFDLGPTGLAVAEPVESGPAAEALSARGPGPFQVLFRTRSMEAAVRWLESRGLRRVHRIRGDRVRRRVAVLAWLALLLAPAVAAAQVVRLPMANEYPAT